MRKPNIPTGFIVVGIVLLLIIMMGAAFLFTQQTAVVGSATLGLSQVDMQSSFAPLNGKVWVYNFVQSRLGQYAIGTITTSQADAAYTEGTERPANDFTMKVTYDSQECIYPINILYNTPREQIMKLYMVQFTCIDCRENAITTTATKKCTNSNAQYIYGYHPVGFIVYVVCGTQETGAIGAFDEPRVNSKFTVAVSAKGENYASSFETLIDKSNGLVGPNVYIEWVGNLVTGMPCKSKDSVTPIYSSGSWKVASFDNYREYRNNLNNIGDQKSKEDLQYFIQQSNDLASQALSTVSFGSINSATSMTNALVKMDLQTSIQRPEIVAYIKAAWLGIVTPIGKPKIESIGTSCFSASSDGQVNVKIKNIGTDAETFKVYLDCPNPFEGFDFAEVSLNKDESKIVIIPITADVAKLTKATCTIHADGTQFQDESDFEACVKPNCQCTIGDKRCDSSNLKIEQCVDCIKWQISEDCTTKDMKCLVNNYGIPYCAKEEVNCLLHPDNPACKQTGEICYNKVDDDNDGTVDEADCTCKGWIQVGGVTYIPNLVCEFQKWIMPKVTIFAIILAVLCSLISFAIISSEMKKRKIKLDKTTAIIIVVVASLLIGALVYLLTIWLWWVALLLLILYLLIRFGIPLLRKAILHV